VDMRDLVSLYKAAGPIKLFPYAKDVFYHPNGMLSMTIEIYDENKSKEFSFGFKPTGDLKNFLDLTLIGVVYEENPEAEEGF